MPRVLLGRLNPFDTIAGNDDDDDNEVRLHFFLVVDYYVVVVDYFFVSVSVFILSAYASKCVGQSIVNNSVLKFTKLQKLSTVSTYN